MTDPALTLAFAVLIILFLAATVLAGWLYLLLTERGPVYRTIKTEACDLDLHDRCMKDWCSCSCHVERPAWVNDGQPCRPRIRRGTWRERCNT